MLAALEDWDWGEAFSVSQRDSVRAVEGADVSLDGFTREDVQLLIGIRDGENDEESWECAGQLRDGRWFSLEAWCDYTGWG